MTLLTYLVLLVLLTWLLLTRVRDGFTYLPIVGGGLGLLIGRELAPLLGAQWHWLPAGLGGLLFVAPYVVLFVALRFDGGEAKAPAARKRARLEARLDWQVYDPQWLFDLARRQLPHEKELLDGLAACTRCVEHKRRTYFIPPALLAKRAQPIWRLKTDEGTTAAIYRTLWREVAAMEILDDAAQ